MIRLFSFVILSILFPISLGYGWEYDFEKVWGKEKNLPIVPVAPSREKFVPIQSVPDPVPQAVERPQVRNVAPVLSTESYVESITGMKFIRVTGSCYSMGSPTSEKGRGNDERQHEACVDDFWIAIHEVTQSQWKKIMGSNPSINRKGNSYPVENISWEDAVAFAKKINNKAGMGFRLPTEAEWEFAARAGTTTLYSGSSSPDKVAWYYNNSSLASHPVGVKKPNKFGIYDMSGNVWEWCLDWYGKNYSRGSDNPQGPVKGIKKVSRGGSWSGNPEDIRVARREKDTPGAHYSDVGFRLVMSVSNQ
ncbi:MAG: formylglycine-generating enzyme family protein [Desulfobulbaceae bacterium]|nr:formylglycine-generating enzyme family protein [Desulfobulbaceae bacterium]